MSIAYFPVFRSAYTSCACCTARPSLPLKQGCEFTEPTFCVDAHEAEDAQKRVAPPCPGSVAFFVRNSNFSLGAMLEEFLDDDYFAAGSSNGFVFRVFDAETHLSLQQPVTDLLDVAMLPAAIGGDATSFDEEDGKADEHYSRGVAHPSLMEFFQGLRR